MRKEIEIGEYIRTKKQGIKKVIKINEKATKNKYLVEKGIDKEGKITYMAINANEIISHSKNIVKVIEVGDIIESYDKRAVVIDDYENTPCESCNGVSHLCITVSNDFKSNSFGYQIVDFEIDKILTHEQYEKNCYNVETE